MNSLPTEMIMKIIRASRVPLPFFQKTSAQILQVDEFGPDDLYYLVYNPTDRLDALVRLWEFITPDMAKILVHTLSTEDFWLWHQRSQCILSDEEKLAQMIKTPRTTDFPLHGVPLSSLKIFYAKNFKNNQYLSHYEHTLEDLKMAIIRCETDPIDFRPYEVDAEYLMMALFKTKFVLKFFLRFQENMTEELIDIALLRASNADREKIFSLLVDPTPFHTFVHSRVTQYTCDVQTILGTGYKYEDSQVLCQCSPESVMKILNNFSTTTFLQRKIAIIRSNTTEWLGSDDVDLVKYYVMRVPIFPPMSARFNATACKFDVAYYKCPQLYLINPPTDPAVFLCKDATQFEGFFKLREPSLELIMMYLAMVPVTNIFLYPQWKRLFNDEAKTRLVAMCKTHEQLVKIANFFDSEADETFYHAVLLKSDGDLSNIELSKMPLGLLAAITSLDEIELSTW